jgi:arabinofuranan 3-O-arabinosyltransferase
VSTLLERAPETEPVADPPRRWSRLLAGYGALAFLAYVPLLLTARGRVAADTKQYLYLDPGRLLRQAPVMWEPNVGLGTVTHQTIGYSFPMGPYYWVVDRLGVPDWVAQRVWLGSLLFAAAVGMLYLLRTFGLKGPGVVIAALAYMLTPYVLDYAARISVLLMPWAALPWMIAIVRKALRDEANRTRLMRWRYPAIFALVVQLVGGVNATALLLAGLGPVLWILYAWLGVRDIDARRALGVTVRIGVLTLVASAWWISGLRMQGTYGLNVLTYSETVDVVARTSTPNEVLRGLGYWFFYGQDRLGPWIEAAENYTQNLGVIMVGYGLAALGLLAAAFTRWRHRVFFVLLLYIGVVVAVGAHPFENPSPLGALFKSFATSNTAGLALRSTGRAVPLVVLSLAIFLGLAVNSLVRRARDRGHSLLAWTIPVVAGVLVLANFPALFDGTYYGKNLQRDEAIPQYWTDAIAALDKGDHQTRILEVPGADFASYLWGNTVDPITPGLTDRPYVARELVPYGTPASADLLNAIDRRLQEGVADPKGLTELWRRMGVGDVVARNDIQYERYDLVRPAEVATVLGDTPGLGAPVSYGPPSRFAPTPGHNDELSLAQAPNSPKVAPVVVYPVDKPLGIVRTASGTGGIMLSGDGEGLVDAADIGLLTDAGIVRYSAAYTTPEKLRAATAAGDTLVLTDSNRLRARRWTTVKDNLGFTTQAGEADKPLVRDLGDARLDVFPGQPASAQTTARSVGVKRVRASSYGNTISYTPEDRAARALDGDVETAWRAQAFGDARGLRFQIELDGDITTDHVNLVQPINGGRDRWITDAVLSFDGGNEIPITLGDASRTPAGQTITFPRRTFHTFEIRVVQSNDPRPNLFGQADAVGFAEIRLRDAAARNDIRMREVIVMPTDLMDALGSDAASHPFVIVMAREAVRPVPPRTQPELSIDREFVLPARRVFGLTGNATIDPYAPDAARAVALGIPSAADGGVDARASEFLLGCLTCGPEFAADGDSATAWQTPFVGVRGQWLQYEVPEPIAFDHLDLEVIADGRHSVPTKMTLDVDGTTRTLAIPAIADRGPENATAKVRVAFPEVRGRKIRMTIDDVRENRASMFATQSTRLEPVGIAELGVPGLRMPKAGEQIDSACRRDLMTVDGKPVGVRITGKTAAADQRLGLDVALCDNEGLVLDAGPHTLSTARGKDAGFSIDRLVLDSQASAQFAATAAPKIEVTDNGRAKIGAHVSGATDGFWLVLGQSHSPGWHARIVGEGGKDLGPAQLVDGYANGWYVDAPPGTAFDVVFEWTPQRQVWLAIWVSLFIALLCIVVIAATWRARLRAAAVVNVGDADAALSWRPATGALSPRLRWSLPIAAGVLAALVVKPWVGIVIGLATLVLVLRPRWRTVVMVIPGALLAVCGAYIVFGQIRYNYPAVFEWPTVFPRARTIAWFAVVLLAADALLELVRSRSHSREITPEDG